MASGSATSVERQIHVVEKQIEAVEKQIEAVEKQIKVVEKQIAEVEEQSAEELGEKKKKKLREKEKEKLQLKEERLLLKEERLQLREEKQQLRELMLLSKVRSAPAVTPAGTVHQAIPVLEHLENAYAKFFKAARELPSVDVLREGDSILLDSSLLQQRQPGRYFCLRGREVTVEKLVEGSVSVFSNLYSSDSNDDKRRMPHFNVIIGYPGAGKTTLGRSFPSLFRRFWRKRGLEHLGGLRSESLRKCYVEGIENSWPFNAFMYHSLSENGGGELTKVEDSLAASKQFEQILALRCLYASITSIEGHEKSYMLPYKEFVEGLKEYATSIKFKDVLLFIRQGMGIDDGTKPVFLSFFFDELNTSVKYGSRDATWMQQVLSAYVQIFPMLKNLHTFALITLSTTNQDSTNLMSTGAQKSLSIPIPIKPLSVMDSEEVVINFMKRLANAVRGMRSYGEENIELSSHLRLCLRMTGGMPRLMSFLLRGVVTTQPELALPADELLNKLETFGPEEYDFAMASLLSLAEWDSKRYSLLFQHNHYVLFAAVRSSCLENLVLRGFKVHPTSDITWGILEEHGLVSLNLVRFDPRRDPKFDVCQVAFPPVLLWDLAKRRNSDFTDVFPEIMPRLHSELMDVFLKTTMGSWRNKEESDLQFIIFMILLFKATYPESKTFKLIDIIPETWDMAKSLERLEFKVPEHPIQICRVGRAITSGDLVETVPESGVLSCGNNGLDSILKISPYYLVTQSKCSDDPRTLNAEDIYSEAVHDLTGVFGLEGLDDKDRRVKENGNEYKFDQRTLPLEQLVYIFNTDQSVSDENRKSITTSKNKLCTRIVISNHFGNASPFDRLAGMDWNLTSVVPYI